MTNFFHTNIHNIHQDGSILCQAITCLMIEEIPTHLLRPRVLTHSLIIKSFKKNYRRNFLYFNRKIFISGNKRKPISQKSKKRKPANLLAAPFRLSQSDMKIADMRAKNVCVPPVYGWKPKCFFSEKTYMKSHDWKQVCKPYKGLKMVS